MEDQLRDLNFLLSTVVLTKLEENKSHEAAFYLGLASARINKMLEKIQATNKN